MVCLHINYINLKYSVSHLKYSVLFLVTNGVSYNFKLKLCTCICTPEVIIDCDLYFLNLENNFSVYIFLCFATSAKFFFVSLAR